MALQWRVYNQKSNGEGPWCEWGTMPPPPPPQGPPIVGHCQFVNSYKPYTDEDKNFSGLFWSMPLRMWGGGGVRDDFLPKIKKERMKKSLHHFGFYKYTNNQSWNTFYCLTLHSEFVESGFSVSRWRWAGW